MKRTFTAEQVAKIGADICARVSTGETLRQICREDGMPSKSSFYEWMEKDPELAGRFARARLDGFDAIAEESLEIADEVAARNPMGGIDGGDVQNRKLRIETRLKLLAKWDPKRYGERVAVGGAEDMPPIKSAVTMTMTAEEAYKRMLDGR